MTTIITCNKGEEHKDKCLCLPIKDVLNVNISCALKNNIVYH